MPVVTLQANGIEDQEWLADRPQVINLLCNCLWDEATGDLRARPDCEAHQRDVERYGTQPTPLDGDESKTILQRVRLTAYNHHTWREIRLSHCDYCTLKADPEILGHLANTPAAAGVEIRFFGLPVRECQ